MSKLPSFEQFNESLKADINEGVFHRLPKDIIADELYLASKDLMSFYQNTSAGRDIDTSTLDNVIKNLEKVKKSVKKFNTKEDVLGTVYEASTLVFDEIGAEIDSLKKKLSELMKNTTDKKWVIALGSAYTALSNLDRNLGNADAKLGVISLKESSVNEAKSLVVYPSSKKDHQMIANWLERSDFHAEEEKNYFSFSVADQKDADATETELDKEFSKLGADARFVFESEVNEASVQVAGNAKPSGAQVLATVIVDHLITRDFFKPGIDKMKKDVIKDIQKVIMDSTF